MKCLVYVLSNEDILADNFTYVLSNKRGLPNPGILDIIKAKLKEKN